MSHDEGIKKVAELMDGANIGTLTTLDGTRLVSRPMGLQKLEFDGDLWFFTYKQSNKVAEITKNPQVNVAFENNNAWISIAGTAEVVDDKAKAKELWNVFLKAWFEDGLETEGLTLLKVSADAAEYWDADSPKVVQLFGVAKAAITGERAEGGENKTVEL